MKALLIAMLVLAPAHAMAQTGPHRSGFTIETSLGIGSTTVPRDGRSAESFTSIAGLDLGIGGFVAPDLAVTLRIASTTYFVPASIFPESTQWIAMTSAFVSPALQYWVSDRLFVGGGAGLGVWDNDADDPPQFGVGLDARVGYGVLVGRRGTLFLTGEITAGFFDEGDTVGYALKVGAQLF
jgi:hypothetical protein